jgi:pyochelin synthetase
MSLEALLLELSKCGIKLRHVDGRLDVVAPKGALTPELRDTLTRNKADLISWLNRTATKEAVAIGDSSKMGSQVDHAVDAGGASITRPIEPIDRKNVKAKINGYDIQLGEIESHIQQQAGVREALVRVAINPVNGNPNLVAYIVPWLAPKPSAIAHRLAADHLVKGDDGEEWLLILKAAGDAMESKFRFEQADGLQAFRMLWEAMEAACPIVMARTLAQMGAFADPDHSESVDSLISRYGLNVRHRPLLLQWLEVLVDEGILKSSTIEGQFLASAPFERGALEKRMEDALEAIPFDFTLAPFAQYFQQSARHAASMLKDETNPLEFLFPRGETAVAEAWYCLSASAGLQSQVAAESLRKYVEMAPASQRIEVLEVGAGVGGTSASLFPVLPSHRTRYRYTDVSMFFMEYAKRKFGDFPFIEHGLFHIDDHPESQGYKAEEFDIIVAANVLHNAIYIDTTLRRLRNLLKPGGILLLVESTVNSMVHMLTIGFISSFEHFQDHRKQANRPLMPVSEWRECLAKAGFSQFAVIPERETGADAMGQHVMIAGAPRCPPPLNLDWLSDAVSSSLPSHMVPSYYVQVNQLPLDGNGGVDVNLLPSPWRLNEKSLDSLSR